MDSYFREKTDVEKRELRKWIRASDAVKKTRKIEGDFIEQVRIHQKKFKEKKN